MPLPSGNVRDATGIKPGDRVEVRATAAGGVIIEKAGAADEYLARLHAIAKRRPLRGITTDELMKMSRGDPGEDPALKE